MILRLITARRPDGRGSVDTECGGISAASDSLGVAFAPDHWCP